jgi:hypothetical protein
MTLIAYLKKIVPKAKLPRKVFAVVNCLLK